MRPPDSHIFLRRPIGLFRKCIRNIVAISRTDRWGPLIIDTSDKYTGGNPSRNSPRLTLDRRPEAASESIQRLQFRTTRLVRRRKRRRGNKISAHLYTENGNTRNHIAELGAKFMNIIRRGVGGRVNSRLIGHISL